MVRYRNERITALIAAGSLLEVGGPSTSDLTEAALAKPQFILSKINKRQIFFIKDVGREISKYFGTTCNFEHIFHALETLLSYSHGWQADTVSQFKPPAGTFLCPQKKEWFDNYLLIGAMNELIRAIFEKVIISMNDFKSNINNDKFSNFWNEATNLCPWDIGILNYDDIIEQCLDTSFEDGYEDTGRGFFRFNVFVNQKGDHVVMKNGTTP